MIYIGADHRGFELKQRLIKRLEDSGYKVTDLGNDHLDPEDDYVDFAESVAEAVVQYPDNRGILLCGSGAGIDIVANKFEGIRSALAFDLDRAKQAREHEDVNVLSLPADILDEETAWEMVKSFLTTPFSGEPRHERRLEKISRLEVIEKSPILMLAILATNEDEYASKLDQVEKAMVSDWVQLDLMDNTFVQNKSVDLSVIKKHPTSLKIEAHMMVDDPSFWAHHFIEHKIRVDRFIVPIEIDKKMLDDFISLVKAYSDSEIGFAFNPETSLEALPEEYLLVAQSLLIMSVHPGHSGQDFLPHSLEKIQQAARLRRENNLQFLIGVDGGVSQLNAKSVVDSGADYLVIGSHILEGDSYENIQQIIQAFET